MGGKGDEFLLYILLEVAGRVDFGVLVPIYMYGGFWRRFEIAWGLVMMPMGYVCGVLIWVVVGLKE